MPKRVIDFDAMWGSDKLASCAAWAQAEYAWLYGLADASGCFEITNLRVIWGRVAAIRVNLTIERLEQIFAEFQDKGLLFVWEHEGKRYAHWTGSDVPGRLPPPSWRMRLERFAPPVPKAPLGEYMARFARGRGALAGVGFRGNSQEESGNCCEERVIRRSGADRPDGENGPAFHAGSRQALALGSWQSLPKTAGMGDANQNRQEQENFKFDNSSAEESSGTRDRPASSNDRRQSVGAVSRPVDSLERTQGQDLDLDLNSEWELNGAEKVTGSGGQGAGKKLAPESCNLQPCNPQTSRVPPAIRPRSPFNAYADENLARMSAKELAVARELRVGQGPFCDPSYVRPEVLERIRQREKARAGGRGP